MKVDEDFFDVIEQTKYKIKVSKPQNVEDLSDWFMSREELQELTGRHIHLYSSGTAQTYLLNATITSEVKKWCNALEESGRKSLKIEDDELVDLLKSKESAPLGFYSDEKYGRHGDRVCFARRYQRKKTKATKTDAKMFWLQIFPYAFRDKFDCYPPAVSTYDRFPRMFEAFKKILGWKRCKKFIDPSQVKFYRQIWDNPEEYM